MKLEEIQEYFKCPEKDFRKWKSIFFFVCLPLMLGLYINNVWISPEKFKRPKFKEYEHLRIRRKPYPWDPVRTLFHNPRVNALPTGYEIDVPEDEEYEDP